MLHSNPTPATAQLFAFLACVSFKKKQFIANCLTFINDFTHPSRKAQHSLRIRKLYRAPILKFEIGVFFFIFGQMHFDEMQQIFLITVVHFYYRPINFNFDLIKFLFLKMDNSKNLVSVAELRPNRDTEGSYFRL